jgi:Fic family protein
VLPELVPGTLIEGYARVGALREPLARALMAMFVVSEVHPFSDGNGRTARLLMNAYLTSAARCRIMIPIIYREDYLLPLKALSHHNEASGFIRSMERVQRWVAAFDWAQPREKVRAALDACHAFKDDLRNYRLIFPDAAQASSVQQHESRQGAS